MAACHATPSLAQVVQITKQCRQRWCSTKIVPDPAPPPETARLFSSAERGWSVILVLAYVAWPLGTFAFRAATSGPHDIVGGGRDARLRAPRRRDRLLRHSALEAARVRASATARCLARCRRSEEVAWESGPTDIRSLQLKSFPRRAVPIYAAVESLRGVQPSAAPLQEPKRATNFGPGIVADLGVTTPELHDESLCYGSRENSTRSMSTGGL
jgi:hypothetical protein